jgi:pyruvate/2-oxoglutarate dehydrogenase complex dihydrolipoamide acyltransferase (E2) component
VGMLRSYALTAPATGELETRLKIGDPVNPGTMLAHIQTASGAQEVRTSVPGTLEAWVLPDKGAVKQGQIVALIDPSEEMVWEALRALYFTGNTGDLPDVENYTRPTEGSTARIQQQAKLTAESIQRRAQTP